MRIASGDDGFGLILVMGMSVILLGLVGLLTTVAIRSLQSSQQHAQFEQALSVAETGIDETLANLQRNRTFNPCNCSINVALPFASEVAERDWAKAAIISAMAADPSLVRSTAEGEYIAIRPANKQAVYSMSWVPNRASAKKSRLLKSEYLFAPYKPGNALVSQGDLFFSGSVTIRAAGADPNAFPAPVHTNGNVSGSANSVAITGSVTSTGTYSLASSNVGPGSGGGQPEETVPIVDPNAVYNDVSSDLYLNSWYDLCPDGSIKRKVAADTTGPCTGSQVAAPATTAFGATQLGWTFATVNGVPTWSMNTPNSNFAGVYYAYRGNAIVDGGTNGQNTPWNATVFAEAGGVGCSRTGGNVENRLTDVSAFLPGFVFAAGADLTFSANNVSGSGVFAAADQIYFNTSSASLTGFVVAGDQCPDAANPSKVQGVTINFDNTMEVPIQSAVRTTQWLEYSG